MSNVKADTKKPKRDKYTWLGKTLKIQGKKFKKHRSQGKVRACFCIICVFHWYA